MTPRVVDLSHHNVVSNFGATAEAGIWGVIHKSSEGESYVDPTYAPRRQSALAAGLLWGAYHFNNNAAVAQQVDHFLKTAAPDNTTLMVLDYEDNAKGNMSIQQAVEFLRLLEQRLGRKGAIYSGNRLKETIGALGPADRAYVASHRLWLAQYGPRAVLPDGFASWWLWQYTGDGVGPEPHSIAGISGTGIDLNTYPGTQAQLKAEWAALAAPTASPAATPAQAPAPTQTAPTSQPATPTTPSNPQPATPAKPETPMANPTPATATPAAAQADPIPGIINFIEGFRGIFAGIAQFLPPQYQPIAQAAPTVIEEVLKGVEDVKTKSGGNLAQSLFARFESVIAHGKVITTTISGAPAVAAKPVQIAQAGTATRSEGMPNS